MALGCSRLYIFTLAVASLLTHLALISQCFFFLLREVARTRHVLPQFGAGFCLGNCGTGHLSGNIFNLPEISEMYRTHMHWVRDLIRPSTHVAQNDDRNHIWIMVMYINSTCKSRMQRCAVLLTEF